MTLGLLLTAFSLGIRHGIDWDHIAAITDLTSAAETRRRGFVLSLFYAFGHAAVVFLLGTMAIAFGSQIPESVDTWMSRVVGLTLISLGVWVVIQLTRHGRDFRLRSRWMLVLTGTFAGLRRIRHARSNREIAVAHEHRHEHDVDEITEIHDHSHLTTSVDVREPVPTSSAGRWTIPWGQSQRHSHRHRHELALPVDPFTSYRGRTAAGIGLLHGVGIESPTQIAVFVAATTVSGTRAGLVLLSAWVIGLILANGALAFFAAVGLLHAERSFVVYAAVAIFVAIASTTIGITLLVGVGDLPGITP